MATPAGLPVSLPGSHAGGPPNEDFYKRAVYRRAPRRFEVTNLPATKFSKSYLFGLRIYPILGDGISVISGSTVSEYEIWRSWDDCLWFQDMLEHRYGVISREKRQRLQAGKGVKKNGIYIHDRAASFDSLPPGPDPKSVAKDIHQYLPKLTKRGTLFRATQATVLQRQKEFAALIDAFFEEDVPALIKELRQDQTIRDFFGYWRRDHDLETKRDRKRPKTAPGDSDAISTRSIKSSFFATSSEISLPLSHALPPSPFPPPKSRFSSFRRRPHTAGSTASSSDARSALSGLTLFGSGSSPASSSPPPSASPPLSSAPGRLVTTPRQSSTSEDEHPTLQRKISTPSTKFSVPYPSSPTMTSSSSVASGRRRANSQRAKSSSPRAETFNVTSDFPLFLSSSTRDLLPPSRPPQSPSYVAPGLRTLPEVTEPPLPASHQKDSSISSGRANRKGGVWQDTDEHSSSDGDVLERELLTPVDGAAIHPPVAKSASHSSLRSSTAPSNLSLQSRDSSWRTSSEHVLSRLTSVHESGIEVDFPLVVDNDSFVTLEQCFAPLTRDDSNLTLCHPSPSHRRRSLSQPLPFIPPVPMDVQEEEWSDHGEDIMEACFGGPDPIFRSSEVDPFDLYDGISSELSYDFPYDPPDSPSVTGFPTPRQNASHLKGPPIPFHRPWARQSLSSSPSPQSSTSYLPGTATKDDTVIVKAVLNDAIVMFRTERDVSLAEVRRRVHEKFARTENVPPRSAFVLAYVPPPPVSGIGAKRVSTASMDPASATPLRNEGDWANTIASGASKVTLRVSYRRTQQ